MTIMTMKLSFAIFTLSFLLTLKSVLSLTFHDVSRRAFFSTSLATTMTTATARVAILLLLPPSTIANASLLDDFGADPTKIDQKAAKTPEMLGLPANSKKTESSIEPNLRSNYYYPTNKKRYLPRIKKCSDAIPEAASMIGDENWTAVSEFAIKIADDTILPMKLYTSSLTGGGTNVKVSYISTMAKCANDFEKYQKQLVKAIDKKDTTASSAALEGMATSLQSYRTVGNLLGPDGGGDIPSVDEIRRSACRVQGRRFEQKVMERDARVKAAATATSS